jgi:hypothetical protein
MTYEVQYSGEPKELDEVFRLEGRQQMHCSCRCTLTN